MAYLDALSKDLLRVTDKSFDRGSGRHSRSAWSASRSCCLVIGASSLPGKRALCSAYQPRSLSAGLTTVSSLKAVSHCPVCPSGAPLVRTRDKVCGTSLHLLFSKCRSSATPQSPKIQQAVPCAFAPPRVTTAAAVVGTDQRAERSIYTRKCSGGQATAKASGLFGLASFVRAVAVTDSQVR